MDNPLKPAELKFLWKYRGDKNYDLTSFILNGTSIQYMVFEDLRNRKKVLGKILTSPKEGEAYHWPRLQHENLAPLIDSVSMNEKLSVYILPLIGNNLRNTIHSNEFMSDPECFNKKRAYTEDILWALDYLHAKSLCLMNLTELTINICSIRDKAVICDFSRLFLIERATKEKLDLPALYQAPELKIEYFDPVSAEIWACGVMLLQVFTNHYLPSAFLGEEVRQVLQAVKEINYDVLKEANPAAQIDILATEDLRNFLDLFLAEDPKQRVNAGNAATSSFLKNSRKMVVKDSLNFRKFHDLWNPEHPWNYHHSNWTNPSHRNDSSIFKDLYLQEVADCRAKLKKVPSINKFINLNFIRDSGKISNDPKIVQASKNTKSSGDKLDTENILLKHEAPSSDICSVQNTEKSIMDNKKILPFESMKMDLSSDYTNNINSSILKHVSNCRDIENIIINKDIETNNGNQKNGIISTFAGDEKKCLGTKSQYSPKTDTLIDSTEFPDSINWYLNTHNDKNMFNASNILNHGKNIQELVFLDKEITYPITHAKSEVIERNLHLSTKSVIQQNTLSTHFLQSDPGLDRLKGSNARAVIFYLNALNAFSTHCNENHSQNITILDGVKMKENLKNNICCKYSWRNYRFEPSQNKKKLTETIVPEVNNSLNSCVLKIYDLNNTSSHFPLQDQESWTNQLGLVKYEMKSHYSKEKKFSDGDWYKKDENTKDYRTEVSSVSKIYNERKTNYTFIRRNSYRRAISQGLLNTKKHKIDNATREKHLTPGELKPSENTFNIHFTLQDEESWTNQLSLPKYKIKSHLLTEKKFSDGDLFKKDQNTKDNGTEVSSVSKIHNGRKTNYTFIRRNSYRQAISQSLSNTTKHKIDNATREKHLTPGELKPSENAFSSIRTLSSMENDKGENNCTRENRNNEYILRIRDISVNEENMSTILNPNLDCWGNYLLDISTDSSIKTEKCKKKKTKKWIYYLCPGSRRKKRPLKYDTN